MKTRALQPLGWILLAVAAAVAVWLIAGLMAGVPLTVAVNGMPTMAITPISILAVTIVSGLVAWGLLVLLRHYLDNGNSIWRIVAAVVLILSLAGPLAAEATLTTKVALIVMHVVVAATLVVGLPRSVADRGATARARRSHSHPSAHNLTPGAGQ